jgi:hypothetical protein
MIEMVLSDEEEVNAKVGEIDRLIEDLQKRKQELLKAKEPIRAEVAVPKKGLESRDVIRAERPRPESSSLSEFEKSATALEEALDSLQWKSFKKKEGEWAFLRDRDGTLVDEFQSSKDFVDRLRKESDVVVGKYRYRVSEDRFLNRYFVGTKGV